MGGTFHYFFDAATALWNTSAGKLYETARSGEPLALKRAAEATLRLKAEYVTPQMYGNERGALTKLASLLSDDPEFTLDLALQVSRSAPPSRVTGASARTTRPRLTENPRSPRWRAVLWVSVTAAAILLILDVLATAGLPVPTPIGEIIDRFGEADEAPILPVGPGSVDTNHLRTMDHPIVDADAWPLATGLRSKVDIAGKRQRPGMKTTGPLHPKNPNHANGKERNQANGKLRNQAKGNERERIGDAARPPSDRGPDDTGPPPGPGRPPEAGRPDDARPPEDRGPGRREPAEERSSED